MALEAWNTLCHLEWMFWKPTDRCLLTRRYCEPNPSVHAPSTRISSVLALRKLSLKFKLNHHKEICLQLLSGCWSTRIDLITGPVSRNAARQPIFINSMEFKPILLSYYVVYFHWSDMICISIIIYFQL